MWDVSNVSILGLGITKPYILLQSLPAVESPMVQTLIYLVNNLNNLSLKQH